MITDNKTDEYSATAIHIAPRYPHRRLGDIDKSQFSCWTVSLNCKEVTLIDITGK